MSAALVVLLRFTCQLCLNNQAKPPSPQLLQSAQHVRHHGPHGLKHLGLLGMENLVTMMGRFNEGLGLYETPIMANQMEKKMEHEMETGGL